MRLSLIDNLDTMGNAYYPAVNQATVIEKEIWDEAFRYMTGSVALKTANYTATDNDYLLLVDATSGSVTITLPTAVPPAGTGASKSRFIIKRTDSSGNTVTVATTSSQTIDGVATYTLGAQYDSATIDSDGTNWAVTSKVAAAGSTAMPTLIASGATYTVAADTQVLQAIYCDVVGTLDIKGTLVQVQVS